MLEQLHGDELAEAYGLLARHFAEADEPVKAARYLLAANGGPNGASWGHFRSEAYDRILNRIETSTEVGPATVISSVPSQLCTTRAASTSSLRSACAMRSSRSELLTPSSW